MISNIKTVALYVSDQAKACEFWVDRLGFEVRRDEDMGSMGRWLEVAPPGATTAFVLADATGFDKPDRIGSSADITLTTDDVVELHARLVADGVVVTEPETQEWGKYIKVTDPDGLEFVVSERA